MMHTYSAIVKRTGYYFEQCLNDIYRRIAILIVANAKPLFFHIFHDSTLILVIPNTYNKARSSVDPPMWLFANKSPIIIQIMVRLSIMSLYLGIKRIVM